MKKFEVGDIVRIAGATVPREWMGVVCSITNTELSGNYTIAVELTNGRDYNVFVKKELRHLTKAEKVMYKLRGLDGI